MILEHVWDSSTDQFTNTVDVHVRFLRRKLGESRRRKLIHTIHGYGYKFEPVRQNKKKKSEQPKASGQADELKDEPRAKPADSPDI